MLLLFCRYSHSGQDPPPSSTSFSKYTHIADHTQDAETQTAHHRPRQKANHRIRVLHHLLLLSQRISLRHFLPMVLLPHHYSHHEPHLLNHSLHNHNHNHNHTLPLHYPLILRPLPNIHLRRAVLHVLQIVILFQCADVSPCSLHLRPSTTKEIRPKGRRVQ